MMAALFGQQIHVFGPWETGQILAVLIPALVFALLVITLLVWFTHAKNRMRHEQQMLALQRGLVSEGSGQRARGRSWLWVALGVPVFIAALAAAATVGILTHFAASRDPFHPVMFGMVLALWIVSGVVCLAALIVGGIGLMREQRRASRAEHPPREQPFPDRPPGAGPVTPRAIEETVREQDLS
jgi:anaerobic C4-dicarboxylate transporter